MKYFTDTMRNILTDISLIIALVACVVFVPVSSAQAYVSYTDQDIQQAVIDAVAGGWTTSQIAAAAASMGVTQARMQDAFVNVPNASAVINATYALPKEAPPSTFNPTAQQIDSTLPSSATVSSTALTTVGIPGSANPVYTIDTAGNVRNSAGASVGYFDNKTGSITSNSGTQMNITDMMGVPVTYTNSHGQSVTEVIDNHSYGYMATMFQQGNDWLVALNNNDVAGMRAAVDAANAVLSKESGGAQTLITVKQNADGSFSYGCVNSQNTTIRGPQTSGGGSGAAAQTTQDFNSAFPPLNRNNVSFRVSSIPNIPQCDNYYYCASNKNDLFSNCTGFVTTCPYGCSAGACNPTPPMGFISFPASNPSGAFTATGHLQARPTLVRKGDTTWLYWNVSNVSSCSVSGTNGDSWKATSSNVAGEPTGAINGQTIYTLACNVLPGAKQQSTSETQAVDIAPIFQEK